MAHPGLQLNCGGYIDRYCVIRLKFVQFWKVWEKLGVPFSAELVELFCIPYRLISDQISGEEWASTRVDCGTKAEAILISSQPLPSLRPLSLYTCSLLKQMKIFSIKLYPDPRSIIWVADNFLITQALATLCSLVSVISKSWFLDAIASPSFASLFIISKSWLNSAQITTHPDRRKYSHLIAN